LLAAIAVASILLAGCDRTETDPAGGGRSSGPARQELEQGQGHKKPDRQDHRPSRAPARSPRELAARLVASERRVRAEDTDPGVLDAAAFETQILYRQLARTPDWQDRVLDRMKQFRTVAELHVAARRSLRSVLTTLSDEVPAWEIVEPPPTTDLLRFYREAERAYGVRWELLAAINFVETGFGKIRGLSTAGAQGPMQFISSTWAAYGEGGDVDDPHDAILGAAHYLAANGGDTGTITGPGVENALYRYNNDEGYVDGIIDYAEILREDPRALRGLVRWQIIYLSSIGDLWLPIGYYETSPVPVRQYVAQHPERHLGTATN
jgi:soluble lytic murein transglycosylase-like protein